MKKYEGVLIFKPDVEETTREGAFKRFTDIIEANGKIDEVSEWGMRRLAYEVDYYKEGYYYVISFESSPEEIEELTRIASINDGILRYMFTKREEN